MTRKEKDALIEKIKSCFNNPMQQQSFIYNYETIKTPDGEMYFYKASEVDKSIEKVNAILDELRK